MLTVSVPYTRSMYTGLDQSICRVSTVDSRLSSVDHSTSNLEDSTLTVLPSRTELAISLGPVVDACMRTAVLRLQ